MPKRREKKIASKVGVTNDGRELEVGEEYFSSSCDEEMGMEKERERARRRNK